jgi:uncharacterized protein YndB with AHSA1/START domain
MNRGPPPPRPRCRCDAPGNPFTAPVVARRVPHATHAVMIHAEPDDVWRVLAEPSRLPGWFYGVRRVDFVTDDRRGVGAQWRQVNAYGPLVVTLLNEVTVDDAPHRFTVEAASKPHAEVQYRLDAVSDGVTRVTADMDHELPGTRVPDAGAGDVVGHAILRRSLENLKRVVEAANRQPSPTTGQAPAGEGRAGAP